MTDWGSWLKNKFKFTLVSLGIVGAVYLGYQLYTRTKGSSASASSNPGRTAVALEDDQSTVSDKFARAPYFKVDGEVFKNPYVDALPAGPQTAGFLSGLGVSSVKAGNFGYNALDELQKLGIKAVND